MSLLLLEPDPAIRSTLERVTRVVEPLGLALKTTATVEDARKALEEQVRKREPAVLVLGPNVEDPLAAARSVHGTAPRVRFVFLTTGDAEPLRRALSSPVAMVGTAWEIAHVDGESTADVIAETHRLATKDTRLRTTLARINSTLGGQRPASLSGLARYTTSHRFLTNILQHAREAIVATTPDGRIVGMNHAAEGLLAVPEHGALGHRLEELDGGVLGPRLAALLDLAGDGPDGAPTELEYEHPGRGRRVIEATATEIGRDASDLPGFSIVIRDITSRRELETRLERARHFESLGVLAGGIAHDFNNLLTGIMGYAELAAAEVGDAVAADYLAPIRESGEQGATLCRQMLAYAGAAPGRLERVDVREMLISFLPELKAVAGGSEVSVEPGPALPCVSAVRAQLEQALVNLVMNAAEASEPGATISVRGRLVPDGSPLDAGRVFGSPGTAGPLVVLEVTDSGPGMTAEVADRAFDPFFTTNFTGRGLGLAEVLGIAQAHGGGVGLDTRPGRTTVGIVLPPAAERSEA